MKALLLTTALCFAMIEGAAACDGVDAIMCTMPPTTYAFAQNDPNISMKVARVLEDSWKLAGAKKFAAAHDRLASLNKMPKKTPYETAALSDAGAFVEFGLEDYAGAADGFAASIDSGVLPREGVVARLAAMTQLYWQTNTFDKAIGAGGHYLDLAGHDVDILMIVGKAHYAQRQFPQAAEAFHAAVKTAQDHHVPVQEEWLKLLMSGDYYMHNTPGVIAALEQLAANYPKPEYEADLARYREFEIAKSGPHPSEGQTSVRSP